MHAIVYKDLKFASQNWYKLTVFHCIIKLSYLQVSFLTGSTNYTVLHYFIVSFIYHALDANGFCVVIRFFHPCQNSYYDLRLRRIFYLRFYPLHLISFLNS